VDETYCTTHVAPETADAWRAALATLAELGARLVEIEVPPVAELLPHWSVLCASEALVHHAAFFPARADRYGATFRSFLEWGAGRSGAEVAAAGLARIEFRARLERVFDAADVLACPSAPIALLPARLLPPDAPFSPATAPFQRFTAPFDLSGSPTLSVPFLHGDAASPHSLQLVGPHGEEALLCRVGHAFETARPLGGRRPPHA
jgi:amidase